MINGSTSGDGTSIEDLMMQGEVRVTYHDLKIANPLRFQGLTGGVQFKRCCNATFMQFYLDPCNGRLAVPFFGSMLP